jgi:molybdate transport system substrate-binding protein
MGQGAGVAKLKIMCARSMHQVVGRLADDFRQRSGHDVTLDFGTVGALQAKFDAGETADVVITGAPGMDRLEQAGALVPKTRADLSITRIGVAVRDGAPAPDITTLEAFRQALVAAPRIAFSAAAVGGSAGVYLPRMFGELGLGDEIARKGLPQQSGGEAARRVAEGAADLALTLIAELVAVPGVRVIGPLPKPLGSDTTYCIAVHASSEVQDAGRAFVAALTDPTTDAAWRTAGFERPDRR